MIEVKIPQEINQYDAKLIGPFTIRQAVCGGSAVLLSYLAWHFLQNTMAQETLIGLILLIAVPFGLLGWIKPYGQRFEHFFVGVLFNTLISCSTRTFRSENLFYHIKSEETTGMTALRSKDLRAKPNSIKASDFRKAQKRYRKKTFA